MSVKLSLSICLLVFLGSSSLCVWAQDAGDNLLFVVGGFQHVSSVEVVDLSGRNRNCSTPADFPTYQYHGVGVKSSGVPFVCAGNTGWIANECWKYASPDIHWELDSLLANERVYAAGINLNDQDFWVTGGSSRYTTEVYDGALGLFRPGPDMLEAVQSHCMARLNGSHVVLVGGEPLLSPDTKRGFLFDLTTEEWTELPEMGTARLLHGCGIVQTTRGPELVVAGGGNLLDSSEIFNFQDMEWREGPALPEGPLKGPSSVQLGDSFLLVGGTNDVTDVDSSSILEFDPANESWIVREERLEMGRLYPTAVLINENAGVTECYDQ